MITSIAAKLASPATVKVSGFVLCVTGALTYAIAQLTMPDWDVGRSLASLSSYLETFDINTLVQDLDLRKSGLDIKQGLDMVTTELSEYEASRLPFAVAAKIGLILFAVGVTLLGIHLWKSWRASEPESVSSFRDLEKRERAELVASYLHTRGMDLRRKAGATLLVVGALSLGGVGFLVHFGVESRQDERKQISRFLANTRSEVARTASRITTGWQNSLSRVRTAVTRATAARVSTQSPLRSSQLLAKLREHRTKVANELANQKRQIESSLTRHLDSCRGIVQGVRTSIRKRGEGDGAKLAATLAEQVADATRVLSTQISSVQLNVPSFTAVSYELAEKVREDWVKHEQAQGRRVDAIRLLDTRIGEAFNKARQDISDRVQEIHHFPNQIASELQLDTRSHLTASLTRVGGLVLLVLLVRFLVIAYKYSQEMSAFYFARKDALILDNAGQANNIRKLVEAMSPDAVTFEHGPSSEISTDTKSE